LYRTNAIPSSPVVKADITPWDGTTEEQSEEKEKEVENTELTRVNKILGTKLSKLDDIPVIIQNNVNSIFSSVVGSKRLLNTIVEYQELNGVYTFKTVKDIIKEQTGLDIIRLDNNSTESGVEYEFSDEEGNKYFIIRDGDKLKINSPDKKIVTIHNFEEFKKNIFKILNSSEIERIKQDIDNEDGDTNLFDSYIKDLELNEKHDSDENYVRNLSIDL
jgi:hypothetical protein